MNIKEYINRYKRFINHYKDNRVGYNLVIIIVTAISINIIVSSYERKLNSRNIITEKKETELTAKIQKLEEQLEACKNSDINLHVKMKLDFQNQNYKVCKEIYSKMEKLHPSSESLIEMKNMYDKIIKIEKDKAEKKRLALKYKDNPLRLDNPEISSLAGQKVPYKKWSKWGFPETQEGTNNKYWIAYLPKANISFVSKKSTDKIIFADFGKNKAVKYLKNKESKRSEIIEKQFSGWDGSHRELKSWIKENMNDPKSFDHIKTAYEDKGDYLLVQTTYRGKNAFGALVRNRITAKVTIEMGAVYEIIENTVL